MAEQWIEQLKALLAAHTGALWAVLGLSVGILLSLAAAGIARLVRKRRPQWEPYGGGMVAVQKLHEQGSRKNQQDSFFVSEEEASFSEQVIINPNCPGLLAVVADGMGGLSGGDQVSQTAVTAIANGFRIFQDEPEQMLLELLAQAVRSVNDLLGPDGLCSGGSTLVMGLLRFGRFHYLSVGDSRIYLYRRGALYQLNREHVFKDELSLRAVNGEMTLQEALSHPKGAGLTSFLGMGQLKYVDLPAQPVAISRGDQFILMSDGVYNALTEDELKAALKAGGADAIRAAIQAKGYTNQDNYTAVIVQCDPEEIERNKEAQKCSRSQHTQTSEAVRATRTPSATSGKDQSGCASWWRTAWGAMAEATRRLRRRRR